MQEKISHKPLRVPGKRLVITRNMVESAIQNTKSNAEAARWLGVDYTTWKKYASRYGLFEGHINQSGKGINKNSSNYRVDLSDILLGTEKNPYSASVTKKRLLSEGYLQEECGLCGFNERNIATDVVCLKIDHLDGDGENYKESNVRLLCPNCYYSNNGKFENSRGFCK